MKKAKKDVQGLFEIVENVPADQMAATLDAKLVVLSAILQSTPIKQLPGEWINIALSKIRGETEKSRMRSLNSVLKIILNKLVPYDISIPPPTRVHTAGAPAETSAASSSAAAPVVQPIEIVQLDDKATTATETGESSKPASKPVCGKGKLDMGEYRVSSKVDKQGKKVLAMPHRKL